MDEIEYHQTRTILRIVARTLLALDLEGLLRSIDIYEGAAARDPSSSPRRLQESKSLETLARAALQFVKSLPESMDDEDG